ncbi:hypothetical protein K466DRAFT_584798 [Polyporus arcularius HHB13444]|uniref:Phosphatidic acid phosphatase type 2/haloperoxidase domain-containing protein n=1 Tax=Polyporus arcularius HHB13444 TaxID=1314778 RepID=A0A5C3PHH7_9APHY|nr:hypothetical protein K466DRAFT_584798 [Polyporus arcularius HHB13444]
MSNDPARLAPASPRPHAQKPLLTKLADQNGMFHARDSSDTSYDSRSSTPDSAAPLQINFRKADVDSAWNEKPENTAAARAALGLDEDTLLLVGAAGRQPEEVYTRTMSWWRAAIRRAILRNVEWESQVLANMQARVRHPVLDAYFVYTSSLGTHTFFMIMLPLFFFFGAPHFGDGLLLMLAVGVYVSSVFKDFCCSPRPFAPPVTRLTIGNHHLEYGFPSTHSTNSVSIALFYYDLLRRAYQPTSPAAEPLISQGTYMLGVGVLLFYVFSIVYGRLYTGMHSFTDCAVGIALGAGIWSLHAICGTYVDAWVRNNGFIVPAVIVPLCLYLVHRHPQPVDDCPCFEDAIAFVSVVMGMFVARWTMLHYGYDEDFFVRPMPGSSWATWSDVGTWWSTAAIKTIIGVLTIFVWRIAAKSFCHFVLPPTFRFLSHLVTLPHRRFYTPATDYTSVPPEKGLRPIPSVIDLPHMVELEVDGVGVASSARRNGTYGAVKQRAGRARQEVSEKGSAGRDGADADGQAAWGGSRAKNGADVKHYDADVLTKVFVYCGIGIMAVGVIPVMFEVLGWGVKTS